MGFLVALGVLLGGRTTVHADFPCKGCVTIVPAGAAAGAPLLVALHGDDAGASSTLADWRAAAAAAGAVLLAPECPRDAGCAGSWWRWLQSKRHDPGWLAREVDTAIAALGPRRVVVAGFSGGASYLGWYVPTHADGIAAAAFVAGGNPYADRCPERKVPVRFDIGAEDRGMLEPFARPLRRWFEACGGHELVWEEVAGVGHLGMHAVLERGRARAVLAWLLRDR
ncbi:MAG TPA: hypothetical protein VKE22_19070 [Haliangiales bacterium]|nr:hypothetical protein [Haliangiales bacterium]